MTFERATELMDSNTPVFTFVAPIVCGKVMLHSVSRDSAEVLFLVRGQDGKETARKQTRWLDDVFESNEDALEHQIKKTDAEIDKHENEIDWHSKRLEFHRTTKSILEGCKAEETIIVL